VAACIAVFAIDREIAMSTGLILAASLLFFSADAPTSAAATEQAEAREVSPLEVRRLVRRLDAPQLAQRDAAEQALLALGPAALEHLPENDPRLSAEVKQRLARIRTLLQQTAVEAAGAASQINLKADAMPLSAVLDSFAEQSGNRIVDGRADRGQPTSDPPITVELDDESFWPALDKVLDRAGLTVYPFGEAGAITVVARPEGYPRRTESAAYSGPFRIEPIRVLARRELQDPDAAALQVFLEIVWEPRLEPIAVRQPLSEVDAKAADGSPLPTAQSEAELEVPVHPGLTAVELMLPMELPPRSIEQIGLLQGNLKTLLPGRKETFRFDDLAEARDVRKRIASATVTFDQMRRNRDIWEVRIRVRFDEPGGALESHRGWILNNDAYLVGADGEKIEHVGFETTRQAQDEVGIAYLFELEGDPEGLEFVYETPGAILQTEYTYELNDIPLP
jgi:hypothetical protein